MSDANARRVWLIGGTGMLSGLAPRIAVGATDLTLVARRRSSLERVAGLVPSEVKLHLVEGDWNDRAEYVARLSEHADRAGAPHAVVAWLHDLELGPEIARRVCSADPASSFLQVCGSRTRMGALLRPELTEAVNYRWVVLGSISSGANSRWLTHEEIVDGVWSAWTGGKTVSVVGTLPTEG